MIPVRRPNDLWGRLAERATSAVTTKAWYSMRSIAGRVTQTCIAGVLAAVVACVGPARATTFPDTVTPNPSGDCSNSTGNWTASGGDYYAQQPNNNPLANTFLRSTSRTAASSSPPR